MDADPVLAVPELVFVVPECGRLAGISTFSDDVVATCVSVTGISLAKPVSASFLMLIELITMFV